MIVNTRLSGQSVAPSFLLRDAIILLFLAIVGPLAAGQSSHAPAEQLKAWEDAKFGLFFHFGPWSQTGNGLVWEMQTNKDPEKRKQFFELYKTFDPKKFDADEWAKATRESGAKYAVFTTKHHDGFCNFDSGLTDYKITSPLCPYSKSPHPDLTAEFVRAMRAQNLLIGLYYSHIDWHHPGGGWHHDTKIDEEFIHNHPTEWHSYVAYERGQVLELLTRYGSVDMLWFDVYWPKDGIEDARHMLKMVRSVQPNLVINDRGTDSFADYETPEQGVPEKPPAGPWESCITISEGNGFWYKGPNATYKSTDTLIRLLIDIVSKGGHLLLNVGPRSDGTWPPEEAQRLKEMGGWLSRNGAAVYGCSRSPLEQVPTWGRVTQNGTRLYAIVFDHSQNTISVPTQQKVVSARYLDGGAAITIKQSSVNGSVEVNLAGKPATTLPFVIVLETAASR